MTYQLYKVLHIIGIVTLMISLGALINRRDGSPLSRKFLSIMHGVALVVILVAGFGLMARLGIPHANWPLWIWLKFAVWLSLGAYVAAIKRRPQSAIPLLIGLIAFGATAAWIVIYRP